MHAIASVGLLALGCAGTYESAVREDLDRAARALDHRSERSEALDPSLGSYLRYAAAQSPEVRAAFERWRASVHRIAPSRTLPDPALELGAYVWSSSDGAGFTPARLGLRQELPWPTKLSAGADATSAEARAYQRRFEALLLDLGARVTEAYHRLWLLRRTRAIELEQLEILRGLSESSLGQLATGGASLADQQQIDLGLARLRDSVDALSERERAAEAQLRSVIGAPRSTRVPTAGDPPALALPAESDDSLHKALLQHPDIESFALMEDAARAMGESSSADRLPGLMFGVEWMRMPGSMGESAVMPSIGIRLPVWQGAYQDAIDSTEAVAAAQRAEAQGAVLRARAELEEALSMLRDTLRRAEVKERTLLPQAEAAYASVLGAYAAGRGSVIACLMAQRELLAIRLELEEARIDHALAWARLERVAGRPVGRRPAKGGVSHAR